MYSIEVNPDSAVVSTVVAVFAEIAVAVVVEIGTTKAPQDDVVPSVVKYLPEFPV